jgi:anti-sigma regulatory factor (Ser/Thr protein kinase)
MLYTDGLVERRDVTLDEGIMQLSETVAKGMNLDVDAVADSALSEMAPPAGYDDDIAIVVYRQPHPRLAIDDVATAEQLSDIRHELAAWMQAAELPDERIADIVLAVNEACANSIEHGYRGRTPGRVRVDGENDGARVHLTVVDTGSWKPNAADPGARGRGLLLIRAVSDWLEMECTPSGTTVDMNFNLS